MKANAVKYLAENCQLDELLKIQDSLENELPLHRQVDGDDDGERLTHILGAIWIHEQIKTNNSDLKTEWRNFIGRVRNSIS